MKPRILPLLFGLLIVFSPLARPAQNAHSAEAPSAAAATTSWQLVWSDEFNDVTGTPVNSSKWSFETGGAWGNGTELQYYTNRTANAVQENGNLVIKVLKENYGGNQYTSARLSSQNKGDFKYGRWEFRAKMPRGKGIWPALWLMPTDSVYGSWPKSGEIDLMEMLGQNTNKIYGTAHYPNSSGGDASSQGIYTLPNSGSFADAFHIFALEWDPGQLRWYVDGNLYYTFNKTTPFDQRFYTIMNVAVGGNWPGAPDATTVFPQYMYVDYVRVYQASSATPPPPTATPRPATATPRPATATSTQPLAPTATQGLPTATATQLPPPSGWSLMWSDEFNAASGTAVNSSKWNFETGGGWGNGTQLQYYTNRTNNAVQENGSLVIKAIKESYGGSQYTSARLNTMGKGDLKYGRVDVRARLPKGKGLWPAIWMMPTSSVYGGWPLSGDLVLAEARGDQINQVRGKADYADASGNAAYTQATYTLPAGQFSDGFHTFTLEWDPGQLRWYVDGTIFQTLNKAQPFDQSFYLILNVAVGGSWPGSPDSTTTFPQYLYVDYVRMYQRTTAPTATRTAPTATQRPATATQIPPTATQRPPTATPTQPPAATATQVQPTATQRPATASPTATQRPATATLVPPTATPSQPPIPTATQPPSGWNLVWSDEFNAASGTAVNAANWNFDTGGAWGNGTQLQYYTDRINNAIQENGNLVIKALRESFSGNQYTSARINSQYKVDFTYGKVEVRAKLPAGKGLWPAIWMMPTDSIYGAWPASGDLVLAEARGDYPNQVQVKADYTNRKKAAVTQATYTLPTGTFADEYHIFSLEWDPTQLRWYVDGNLVQTLNKAAPFDQNFYLILNVAVGGSWPGSPDGSTVFPQAMYVDYVRIYQHP